MKKCLLLLSIVAMTLFSAVSFASTNAPKYGVINLQTIMSQSNELQAAATKLKKQFTPMQASLKKQATTMQSDIQNLQKNQATMKKSDLIALQKKIQSEQLQLQTAQGKMQQQAMLSQQAAMKVFMSHLKKAAAYVASKKGFSVVFPNNAVIFYGNSANITSDVLAKLNA